MQAIDHFMNGNRKFADDTNYTGFGQFADKVKRREKKGVAIISDDEDNESEDEEDKGEGLDENIPPVVPDWARSEFEELNGWLHGQLGYGAEIEYRNPEVYDLEDLAEDLQKVQDTIDCPEPVQMWIDKIENYLSEH
ncbi:hypothetical protein HDV02_003001 [Globomyces sp. JEL0801]|nr:hypothetical protein HDV02_003001 [Globomyces sp. JEL0801]